MLDLQVAERLEDVEYDGAGRRIVERCRDQRKLPVAFVLAGKFGDQRIAAGRFHRPDVFGVQLLGELQGEVVHPFFAFILVQLGCMDVFFCRKIVCHLGDPRFGRHFFAGDGREDRHQDQQESFHR